MSTYLKIYGELDWLPCHQTQETTVNSRIAPNQYVHHHPEAREDIREQSSRILFLEKTPSPNNTNKHWRLCQPKHPKQPITQHASANINNMDTNETPQPDTFYNQEDEDNPKQDNEQRSR